MYLTKNFVTTKELLNLQKKILLNFSGGRVIILGETGRNFAAGMSGGIAYVLDKFGKFSNRCNLEMVELTKADKKDKVFLKETLEEFVTLTGSEVAQDILDNFDVKVLEFVKGEFF